jgi:hypothetical protein
MMRFVYEHIIEDKLDPGSYLYARSRELEDPRDELYSFYFSSRFDEFCKQFLDENVALVNVELVTKSITRAQCYKTFYGRKLWILVMG